MFIRLSLGVVGGKNSRSIGRYNVLRFTVRVFFLINFASLEAKTASIALVVDKNLSRKSDPCSNNIASPYYAKNKTAISPRLR
jgi:hypothetical protein